jgi:hypothetical protein
MARQVRDRWEEGAGLAVKHRQAGNLQHHLFDVQYQELVRDPMSMVRRIYQHFDLELTSEATTAMQRFLAENPKNKAGVHRYSLEDFGLNPEEERRRFQDYVDFFAIEMES